MPGACDGNNGGPHQAALTCSIACTDRDSQSHPTEEEAYSAIALQSHRSQLQSLAATHARLASNNAAEYPKQQQVALLHCSPSAPLT
jgi:hypothetical protein